MNTAFLHRPLDSSAVHHYDLPHPLQVAHKRLKTVLRQAIGQYERNLRFSNADDVLAAAERFVDEFCRVPDWKAELRRRAVFVEERCQQGSRFRRALDSALRLYKSQPKRAVGAGISGARLAIQQVRRIRGGLWLVDEVVDVRETLQRAIVEGIFGMQVKPAVEQWIQECRGIQHDAKRIEADGCYFLHHAYCAVQPNPSVRSLSVKAIIETGAIGGAHLRSMLEAAKSLVSWAREYKPKASPTTGFTERNGADDASHAHEAPVQPEAVPFDGGKLAFFDDRVELCGVNICSGRRSRTKRRILELLRKTLSGKGCPAYSGEELAIEVGLKGGQAAAAGAIRDLRDFISESLLNGANIECGRFDVILSGGPGYRLSDRLSVESGEQPEVAEITDNGTDDVRNERGEDARNVRSRDVRKNTPAVRQEWILQRIDEGRELQAPAVAKQFKCHVKTAQRDLTALVTDGIIEFVGPKRTGYYRRTKPSEQAK